MFYFLCGTTFVQDSLQNWPSVPMITQGLTTLNIILPRRLPTPIIWQCILYMYLTAVGLNVYYIIARQRQSFIY